MIWSWNIAVGNFFFQYRNFLFPVIFIGVALTMRPEILFGNIILHRIVVAAGAVLAVLGELVRLVTIGFEYIHRGGKNRQVYAKRLVSGGMYGVTRNPMYVGNALIAIGVILYIGSPLAAVIVIPFFLFVYQAIVCAEENYLRAKFGAEYEAYCAAVYRFVPSVRAIPRSFAGMRFDWNRAVKRDMGTFVGLTIGLILVPVWRTYFLYGWDAARSAGVRSFAVACAGGLLYALLVYLKKRKLFIFRSTAA